MLKLFQRHDETRKELFKFAAQRWKQMSAEDKARYITAAKNVNKPKPLKVNCNVKVGFS